MICRPVIFLFILHCVISGGCDNNADQKKGPRSAIVARAGKEELDKDEFRSRFVSTGIIKDSLYNAKKSIENWAIESLFYQEAISKLNPEELQIEKQVDDYRRSLVNYVYQGKMVDANLDTVITYEEIENYYNEHRDNFISKGQHRKSELHKGAGPRTGTAKDQEAAEINKSQG